MPRSLYFEDQNHRRIFTETDVSRELEAVVEKAPHGGLLSGVDVYGDTMFNVSQLWRIDTELDAIAEAYPEVLSDVQALKVMVEKVLRRRGYFWIVGD